MECNKARLLLSEYIDGFTDARKTKMLKKHLLECEACRQEFFSLRRLANQPAPKAVNSPEPEKNVSLPSPEAPPKPEFTFVEIIRDIFFPPHLRIPFLRWQRRWFIMIPLCLCMIAGIYISVTTPVIYETGSLILLDMKPVDGDSVFFAEQTFKERLTGILQELKSRAFLEQLIAASEIFSSPAYANLSLEEKIVILRNNISVKKTRGLGDTETVRISLRGSEPEKIAKSANMLTEYLVAEGIGIIAAEVREKGGQLETELRSKAEQLSAAENSLREYRTKHMGTLPEQFSANQNTLAQLRRQAAQKQESLNDEEIRLIQLEDRISEIRKELENHVSESLPKPVSEPVAESEDTIALRQMKAGYERLTARYTQQHPDVIRLKKKIAEAESEIAKQAPAHTPDPPKTKADIIAEQYRRDQEKRLKEAEHQFQSSSIKAARLNYDISDLIRKIRSYEKRIKETPAAEQGLAALNREYDKLRDSYEALLKKKLDTDVAASMQMKLKTRRIRVLDSAKIPREPIHPNVKILFMSFVGAGLGIGFTFIFLLEICRKIYQVSAYQPKDNFKKTLNWILSFFSVLTTLLLFLCFGMMALNGASYAAELWRNILFFTRAYQIQ